MAWCVDVGVAMIAASISPIKLAIIGHGPRLRFLGYASAGRLHRIDHRHQFDFIERGGNAGVNSPQMAGPDDGNT